MICMDNFIFGVENSKHVYQLDLCCTICFVLWAHIVRVQLDGSILRDCYSHPFFVISPPDFPKNIQTILPSHLFLHPLFFPFSFDHLRCSFMTPHPLLPFYFNITPHSATNFHALKRIQQGDYHFVHSWSEVHVFLNLDPTEL